jgi:hypothetical protein
VGKPATPQRHSPPASLKTAGSFSVVGNGNKGIASAVQGDLCVKTSFFSGMSSVEIFIFAL